MISPARRARIRKNSGAIALFVAFLAGMVVQVSPLGVILAIFGGFLLFALFQAYLLWCLDTVNVECREANLARNTAVAERDHAYKSRDEVWARAQGLIKTSEEVVAASQEIIRQREETLRVQRVVQHHGLVSGEPSVLAQIVAEAQQRGVDVEYVTLDDLDGV